MKNKESLQTFLSKFKDLHCLRTNITEQFNPYVKLIETEKAIGELNTTYPADEASRDQLHIYANTAEIKKLSLKGEDKENVQLEIEPHPTMTALKLKDMSKVELGPFFEKLNKYQLESLELIRIEQITKELFELYVHPCLMNSTKLRKFRFEINHENFNTCFD